ncbi:uncharacterized protein LOC141848816 [Brevipalpus obovatus]|uniref:uncharacterized protein LOC141848816 n=1 Tax=Brevipalpus obovatus TaxID=246614 RepID=UPI003D9DCB41
MWISSLVLVMWASCALAYFDSADKQSERSHEPLASVQLSPQEPKPDSSNQRFARVSRRGGAPPSIPRSVNSVEEEYQPMEPYAFGFNVKDDLGNNQYRREEADADGTIKGSYGYTDSNGLYRIVEYIADKLGFRTKIRSNEPGMKSMNSPFLIMEAQEPPEAVVAAASAPRPVVAKSEAIIRPVNPGLNNERANPRFRYLTSSSEIRPVAQPNEQPKPSSSEELNRSQQ